MISDREAYDAMKKIQSYCRRHKADCNNCIFKRNSGWKNRLCKVEFPLSYGMVAKSWLKKFKEEQHEHKNED